MLKRTARLGICGCQTSKAIIIVKCMMTLFLQLTCFSTASPRDNQKDKQQWQHTLIGQFTLLLSFHHHQTY